MIFADTIVELGGVKELANYGEYSGGPNEEQTYAYARTVIDLMCKHKHPEGKVTYTHHKLSITKGLSIYDGLLMTSLLHRLRCFFVPPIFES